ncbi:hypothetical protein BMS3Abin05_00023 [bacterium BMS3Abin05]|nr:hypothetical protein BMS3Abin05_00023 [bacterium BMS3Abin05]
MRVQNNEWFADGGDNAFGKFSGLLHSPLRFAFLGLVAENQHHADNFTFILFDRRTAVGNGNFLSVFGNKQGVVGQSHHPAFAQDLLNRILCLFTCFLVNDLENALQPFSHSILFYPAGQFFGARIQILYNASLIGGHDGITNAFTDSMKPFLIYVRDLI